MFQLHRKITWLLLFLPFFSFGQAVHVPNSYETLPLSEVLADLVRNGDMKLSYNPEELSNFHLSTSGRFDSVDDFLDKVFIDKPLEYKKIAGVYVLFKNQKKVAKRLILRDKETGVEIPNAHIALGKQLYCSNDSGSVQFETTENVPLRVQIQHIAFKPVDSMIQWRDEEELQIDLRAKTISLEPINVRDTRLEPTRMVYFDSGKKRVTQKGIPAISGYAGERLWAMLKTLPGIFSAHEAPSGYLIKGDMPGQAGINLEGIRLHEMEHLLGNISGIQPAAISEISFSPHGDKSQRGDFSGGLLQVKMKRANPDSFLVEVGTTALMGDFALSTPLWKGAGVSVGFRQTLRDMSSRGRIHQVEKSMSGEVTNDTVLTDVIPYNDFRDGNFIFHQDIGKAKLKFAAYLSTDNQLFDSDLNDTDVNISLNSSLQTNNLGQALTLSLPVSDGSSLGVNISHSKLAKEKDVKLDHWGFNQAIETKIFAESSVEEYFTQLSMKTEFGSAFRFNFGMDGNYVSLINKESNNGIFYHSYDQDEWKFSTFSDIEYRLERTTFAVGGRLNYIPAFSDFVFEPKISVRHNFLPQLGFFANVGRSSQFYYPIVNEQKSAKSQLRWVFYDQDSIPARNTFYSSLGVGYNTGKFGATIQANYRFLKNSLEEKRIGSEKYDGANSVVEKKGTTFRYRALESMVYYCGKNYSATLSYVLSKFDKASNLTPDTYVPTMSDQRHELKALQVFKFRQFQFSMNYIFGSGVPPYLVSVDQINSFERTDSYSRLDVSAFYFFQYKDFEFELGSSVINLLGRENPKFNTSIYTTPINVRNYDFYYDISSLPFTVSLDLRVRFGFRVRNRK